MPDASLLDLRPCTAYGTEWRISGGDRITAAETGGNYRALTPALRRQCWVQDGNAIECVTYGTTPRPATSPPAPAAAAAAETSQPGPAAAGTAAPDVAAAPKMWGLPSWAELPQGPAWLSRCAGRGLVTV